MNNAPDSTTERDDPLEYWKPLIAKLPTQGWISYRIIDPTEINPQIMVKDASGKTSTFDSKFFMTIFCLTPEYLQGRLELLQDARRVNIHEEPTSSGEASPLCAHMRAALQLAFKTMQPVFIDDTPQRNPDVVIDRYGQGIEILPLQDAVAKYLPSTPTADNGSSPIDNVI